LRSEKLEPNLEKFGPHFERIFKESGSGFFVKSGVSYADFYIADTVYSLHGFDKELFEKKCPYFVEHFKKVYALPELQNYLSSRPQVPF
jgi:glutathione S-transferase